MKYTTLAQLAEAYAGDGEISAGTPLMLGPACTVAAPPGYLLFEMRAGRVLEEALTLLGVPWERSARGSGPVREGP